MKCDPKATIVLSLVCLVFAGCNGGPATVPKTFSSYESKDGSFKCDAPNGWSVSDQKGKGFSWVTFKSGSATITVQANDLESIAHTLLPSGENPAVATPGMAEAAATDPKAPSPAFTFHRVEKTRVGQDYEGFKEKQRPLRLNVPMGACAQSEFTATGLKGTRGTAVGGNVRVRVVCTCPEADYDKLKPAFDQVIKSIAYGSKAVIPGPGGGVPPLPGGGVPPLPSQ